MYFNMIMFFFICRFIIYKVPKLTSDGYPIKTSGTEFVYLDTALPLFYFSQKDITKTIENPLYETLKALYDQVI